MNDPVLHIIGEERWVLGLSWLTFAQRPAAPILDATLRHARARYAALREGDVFQLGMTHSAAPSKWLGAGKGRVISLAAALAPLHPPPWRATFAIDDDTVWYIAVRDNYAIMQDGDVAGSHQTIGQVRQRHDVFEDWTDYSGDRASLLSLLSDAGKDRIALVRANSRPARTLSFIAIGVLLCSGAAYSGYHYWMANRLKEELRRAALAQIHAPPPSPILPAHPAADKATGPKVAALDVFLATCLPRLNTLPLDRLGWSLQSAACDTNSIQSTWVKGAYATDPVSAFGAGAVLLPDGRARLSTPLTMQTQRLSSRSPNASLVNELMQFAQAHGLDLQWGAISSADMASGMTQMILVGPVLPNRVAPILEQSAELRLTRLVWSRQRGWSYTILVPASRP